jgi:Fic family protein
MKTKAVPPITHNELLAAWEDLDVIRGSLSMPVDRPPNSFTVAEYAQRYGLLRRTATEQLQKLVNAGKLKHVQCIVDRKLANVYWIP